MLCDLCQEAHLKRRWAVKHNIISLIDSNNKSMEKSNSSVQNTTVKCFTHPTQDLKLYCLKCDQVACHNCTILLHKGHQFETIEHAKHHIIKSFKISVERNRKFHDDINLSISKLADCVGKINANADAIRVN